MRELSEKPTIKFDETPPIEGIKSAEDAGGAMKHYLESLKQTDVDRAEAQKAMAEKLFQLGDIDTAMRFVLLAGETENTAKLKRISETSEGITAEQRRNVTEQTAASEEFSKAVDRLKSVIEEDFGGAVRGISNAADIFNTARGGLASAVDGMSEAATKNQRAADTMADAASRMPR